MSSKILIGLIILAVLLVGGGYFFWQQKDSDTEQSQVQTPQNTLEEWKTYSNSDFGFELKYPSTMTVTETPGEIADSKWVTVYLKSPDFTISFFAGARPTGGAGEGYEDYKSKQVTVAGKQVTESVLTNGDAENPDFLFSLYTRHADGRYDNFSAHLKQSQLETAVPAIESVIETLSYR